MGGLIQMKVGSNVMVLNGASTSMDTAYILSTVPALPGFEYLLRPQNVTPEVRRIPGLLKNLEKSRPRGDRLPTDHPKQSGWKPVNLGGRKRKAGQIKTSPDFRPVDADAAGRLFFFIKLR